ncbi:MAG: ornithine cyclodeaminase family protein [Synergistaceae bacterium]|nr:ornithine cyclodeaminase family protein [Synergistaceae bacterium]
MYPLRLLDRSHFEKLVGIPEAIEGVEQAYRLFSRGEAGVFPVIVHQFEPGRREMDLKAGHLAGAGVFGMKMLGWCAENPARNLPPLAGLIIVMDVDRQQPLGILDGTPVTFLRTGAAGAIGARTFARKDSRTALIVGAGNQGRAQLLGLSFAMPQLETILVADILESQSARFVEEQQALYPRFKLQAVPFSGLSRATEESDLIITCTRSREFFLKKEWVSPGTHINAIGADMPGKQELEPALVASAKVFADSATQVVAKGECQHAAKLGLVPAERITEIGTVLEGMKPGRLSAEEITLFDATGMAIQDLMVAAMALNRAEKKGIGTVVHF